MPKETPRKTKIIATMGPACDSHDTLLPLIEEGVDIVRLNLSHGDHSSHSRNIAVIREVEKTLGRPICILGDLKGPEIRTGKLKNGEIQLNAGDSICLTPDECDGDNERIQITHEPLYRDVSPGQLVYMSDGAITLVVESISGHDVCCKVQRGGKLGERKGLNFPAATLSLPFLMEKDYEDIRFLIKQNIDFIAASFVRSAYDLKEMRRFMNMHKGEGIKIVAKIETQQAVDELEEIVMECDGVMVARGDLGVEIPIADVPLAQKRIISVSNARGIPVITATQMLDSMTWNAYPTRAEATDVANAIMDGTDAIMLSGETAVGSYPALTVETMHKLAVRAESVGEMKLKMSDSRRSVSRATSAAACLVADQLKAAAIITVTSTGASACRIARNRPQMPIIACSHDKKVIRQLLMVWGVCPFYIPKPKDVEQMQTSARDIAKDAGFIEKGDIAVLVSGIPIGVPGSTNSIEVEKIR